MTTDSERYADTTAPDDDGVACPHGVNTTTHDCLRCAESVRLDDYLDLIERERESRPAEAMLADEIRRLRGHPDPVCRRCGHNKSAHLEERCRWRYCDCDLQQYQGLDAARLQREYDEAGRGWRVASLAADAALTRYHAAFNLLVQAQVRAQLFDGTEP